MARTTITVTSGQDAGMMAVQELVAVFEAALAVLVADGASPTQAHVTTANNAYTAVKAVWTNNLVLDYDRAVLTTQALVTQAINSAQRQASTIG